METLRLLLPFPEKAVTQHFNENANPLYAGQGLRGHTAWDFNAYCGTPLKNCADNAYVYSTMNRDNGDLSRYRAIFTLVEVGDVAYEISYGHLDQMYVEIGKTYQAGDILGTTGNTGDVYIGATKVTQYRPGCPGGHLHGPQVRPCKKVSKRTKNSDWYLYDGHGVYKTQDGFFLEVLDYENGWNGCVDPGQFFVRDAVAKQWNRDLFLGSQGEDVRVLQRFLNARGFYVNMNLRPGSPGNETDFYGPRTVAAVARYQKFVGISPYVGYFGPKTRDRVNSTA